MCGIAGYLSTENQKNPLNTLTEMGKAIFNRGPDSSGQWFDPDVGIGLAHQRLAIVDLSPAGHQPMLSNSGRYILSFNGEIYNHNELREKLRKVKDAWLGHSDTETLLAGFEAWGIEDTIKKTVGMFAIAVWDRKTETLTLGRDRLGEKPLYYGWQDNTFLFASELKAIKAHPSFDAQINRNSLSLFLRYGYIPAPYSIYENIYKLMPGTLATVSLKNREVTATRYWSLEQEAVKIRHDEFCNYGQAVLDLEQQLKKSIGLQMMADVPLGAFLSGGVDSSTIVALMQSQSDKPIKTFSIGFHEAQYNEAHYAKAIAKHLNTDHTELYVSADDALKIIPKLAEIYDEPFADASQVPTFLVARMASEHVTVSLSGDAGDEVFCGYNRYLMTRKAWHTLSKIPVQIRRFISNCITCISPNRWNQIINIYYKLNPFKEPKANTPFGDKLYKVANVICAKDMPDLYKRLTSIIQSPENYLFNSTEPDISFINETIMRSDMNDVEKMMLIDMHGYLPNDILAKVDRAAMAVSLETRVPLLDHRIVELAWKIPLRFKLNKGKGKAILRDVLYKYVPRQLIERPKMGFAIPIDSWLRGPLKAWAENLLNEVRLQEEGFLNVKEVRKMWEEHLSERRNWQYQLWNILMFQLWLKHNAER